ncbi:hypothetical protein TNIN_384391 [Trichonephila inaurata madagascariensis]|uniref:Uncharacterized protein n=1 Tax=Trichonephila inaurata madagascariensis TaxID=2747483 RepID=A0A8X6IQE4_9ARAC|nr:hypothetical protein TNIN_384391 [Trichonephila inaurata madagascariensis]
MKEMLDNIVDERKSLEVEDIKKIEREDKCLADQRAFELEKLKLQAQNPPASVGNPQFRKSHSLRVEKDVSGNHNSTFANPSYMPARNTNTGCHPPIFAKWLCATLIYIKAKMSKNAHKKESASVNATDVYLSYLPSSST